MRHTAILMALALLTVGLASAQESASIRFVVRDPHATPQRGIRITLDLGDGRGPRSHVTDDRGATERLISPTGLVTVTHVLDADNTPLTFEMTTLDGRLVLPLTGDREIPWAYDRASRSVISLPRTMSNEAFPELSAERATSSLDLRGTPAPAAGTPAPILVSGDAGQAEAGGGAFGYVIGGIVLIGAASSLWVGIRATRATRATQTPRRDPRRRRKN